MLFGQLPERIASRRCRRSYGVGTCEPWTADDAISASTMGYPEKSWHETKRCYYVAGSEHVRVRIDIDAGASVS